MRKPGYTSCRVEQIDKTPSNYYNSIKTDVADLVKLLIPTRFTGKVVIELDLNQGGVANVQLFQKQALGK